MGICISLLIILESHQRQMPARLQLLLHENNTTVSAPSYWQRMSLKQTWEMETVFSLVVLQMRLRKMFRLNG